MKVVFRLADHDGDYSCDFSDEIWQQLLAFRTYAQELSATRLLSNPGCFDFGMSWKDGDEEITFEPRQMPDPDEFRAFLHLMRPFVLNDELTFYPRIRKILYRQLHTTPFQSLLNEQLDLFRGKRCQSFMFMADGIVLNSDETLMKWLNAFEYHRDEDKRQELTELHDVWRLGFSQGMWGAMMLHKARAIVELAGWVIAAERGLACKRLPGWTPPDWEREGFEPKRDG